MRRKIVEDTYLRNSETNGDTLGNDNHDDGVDDDVDDDVVFVEEHEHSNRLNLFRSKGSKYVSKSNFAMKESALSPYLSQETTQSRNLKKAPPSIFQRRRRRNNSMNSNLQSIECKIASHTAYSNQSKKVFHQNNFATDASPPDMEHDKQNSYSVDHEDIFANVFHSLDQNNENCDGDNDGYGDGNGNGNGNGNNFISSPRKQLLQDKNDDSLLLNSLHEHHSKSNLTENRHDIISATVPTSHNSNPPSHPPNHKFNQKERLRGISNEHPQHYSYENKKFDEDHEHEQAMERLSSLSPQHTKHKMIRKTPKSKGKICNAIGSSTGKRKSCDASQMITSLLDDCQDTESILDTARNMEIVRQKRMIGNRDKKKKRKQTEISPKSIQMKQVQSIAGSIPKHWKSKTARATIKTNTNALSQATKYSQSILTSSLLNRKNQKARSISPTKKISTKSSEIISNDGQPQNITDIRKMKFRPSLLKNQPIELPNNEDNVIGIYSLKNHHSSEESNIFGETSYCKQSPLRLPSDSMELNSQDINKCTSPSKDSDDDQTLSRRDRRKKRRDGNRRVEGPLSKRLKFIKSQLSGDWVRLRSGSYSFGSKDINDPRNRANMFIDVTVLSDCKKVIHANDMMKNIGNNVLLLGYIHKETKRNNFRVLHNDKNKKDILHQLHLTQTLDTCPTPSNSTHVNPRNHSEQPSIRHSSNMDNDQYSSCFAWFYFNKNTLQEQKINAGAKLRLYNCIIMPSKKKKKSNVNVQEKLIVESSSLPIVVCTTLCEPYPATLPPLSKIPLFQIANKNFCI